MKRRDVLGIAEFGAGWNGAATTGAVAMLGRSFYTEIGQWDAGLLVQIGRLNSAWRVDGLVRGFRSTCWWLRWI